MVDPLSALSITRLVLYFSSLRALYFSKERLWGILSVMEIPDFIASRTPSKLDEETGYCLGFIFHIFRAGLVYCNYGYLYVQVLREIIPSHRNS